MPLNKIKHNIIEISGTRCSLVEKGVSEERMKFLKELLEVNKYVVKVLEEKAESGEITYTLGVTDILFNPVMAIYERSLKSQDGFKITPAYWEQQTTIFDPRYWRMRRKTTAK